MDGNKSAESDLLISFDFAFLDRVKGYEDNPATPNVYALYADIINEMLYNNLSLDNMNLEKDSVREKLDSSKVWQNRFLWIYSSP